MDGLLGKILRLEIRGDDFPGDVTRNYAIPADNPFAGVAGVDDIWALGLRNPWRPSFDRALDGGSGKDTLIGGLGHDDLIGGTGTDIRNGDIGFDTLSGDNVADDLDVITLSNGASIGPNNFLFA